MSTRAPRLPQSIPAVVVPSSFAVSSLVRLERCPLSVLGIAYAHGAHANGLLTPHPLALLGSVLHHARAEVLDGRWGEADCALAAFRFVFQAAVTSAEAQLRDQPHTRNLVPLRAAVGRREWLKRVAQGDRWASGLEQVVSSGEAPRALGPLLTGSLPNASVVPAIYEPRLGTEEPLRDAELRLKGRPDWSELRGSGVVAISEFKSGMVVDEAGRLLEEHVIQVQAYALMLERAQPGVTIEPYIEGVGRTPVPWGEAERQSLVRRLRALDARLPNGHELSADDLASPGSHCRFCRIRPLCARYLREVPSWWPDVAGTVRPLPLDVWGVVEAVNEGRTGGSLRLTDAIGRRVLVDGLSKECGLSDVSTGDAVWLFDMESSEDLDQHGAKIQPRNFHQTPPGPRWSPALRLHAFRGQE